ncbi:MAG TPA: hypothetical protein VD834_03305 [Blastococcus sp.]|nr:hypothetical protein [Blastococcus sp.]
MNTYDPMNCIVYRRMARQVDPYAVPLTRGRACSRLPDHYANESLRTRLRMS